MTVLINLTSRDPDVFYRPKPNWHGKPAELLRVESKVDELWGRHLRLCDYVPLPKIELDEIEDEIKQLEKIKSRLWNDWQENLITEKEQVR